MEIITLRHHIAMIPSAHMELAVPSSHVQPAVVLALLCEFDVNIQNRFGVFQLMKMESVIKMEEHWKKRQTITDCMLHACVCVYVEFS